MRKFLYFYLRGLLCRSPFAHRWSYIELGYSQSQDNGYTENKFDLKKHCNISYIN